MKLPYCLTFILIFSLGAITHHEAQWTVVGAGPAGIAAITALIESGVARSSITWIDPMFNVGWLGEYCHNVPANQKTEFFLEFFQSCQVFQECSSKELEHLYACDLNKEYPLGNIVKPLQEVTQYLCTQVNCIQAKLTGLDFNHAKWILAADDTHIVESDYVILATGSKPRELDYTCACTIPLHIAIDKQRLAHLINKDDTVAVVGSAHSAILIMKYLWEFGTARIINFYKKPLTYPIPMGNFELNAGAGLRGEAARWAHNILEENPPANILRLYNNKTARTAWLPLCTKIIYACGFERNDLPPIDGDTSLYAKYDTSTGVIAPRLFGVGIAFPEIYQDPAGNYEIGIGLTDFMEYIQEQLPGWMKKRTLHNLHRFNNLFVFTQL